MEMEREGEVELMKGASGGVGGTDGEVVERDEVEMGLMSDGEDGTILRQEEDTPGICFFRDENI